MARLCLTFKTSNPKFLLSCYLAEIKIGPNTIFSPFLSYDLVLLLYLFDLLLVPRGSNLLFPTNCHSTRNIKVCISYLEICISSEFTLQI